MTSNRHQPARRFHDNDNDALGRLRPGVLAGGPGRLLAEPGADRFLAVPGVDQASFTGFDAGTAAALMRFWQHIC